MNEQNKHAALTIAQKYPPAQYNLLVPMQTVTEIADINFIRTLLYCASATLS